MNDRIWGFYYQKDIFIADLLAAAERAGVQVLSETVGLSAENIPGGVRLSKVSR
jgi:hypothetical protein